jgi:prepilin-type processing-associated H-X9-DG protein
MFLMAFIITCGALALPLLARHRVTGSRINCVNNLKQIGLSFRTWALDNSNCYPAMLSVTNGGTKELVGKGETFMHFAVMSNELSTPKILICPEEANPRTTTATTFSPAAVPGFPYVPFSGNSNVSYFVGVDARDDLPQAFLSGDRGFGIAQSAFGPGLHLLSTNLSLRWAKGPHKGLGNVAFADGSVQQLNNYRLQDAFKSTGLTTNRLEIP